METRRKPQQARALATRDAIVQAAAKVFDERGYVGASIDLIISEAQVTKGALYFHFASKAELAVAVVEGMTEVWAEVSERVATEAARFRWSRMETLHQLGLAVAIESAKNVIIAGGIRLDDEWVVIPVEMANATGFWMEQITAILADAQAAGEIAPTVDVAAAARTLVGTLHGIERLSRRRGQNREAVSDRVDEAWALILPAFTDKAPASS